MRLLHEIMKYIQQSMQLVCNEQSSIVKHAFYLSRSCQHEKGKRRTGSLKRVSAKGRRKRANNNSSQTPDSWEPLVQWDVLGAEIKNHNLYCAYCVIR